MNKEGHESLRASRRAKALLTVRPTDIITFDSVLGDPSFEGSLSGGLVLVRPGMLAGDPTPGMG